MTNAFWLVYQFEKKKKKAFLKITAYEGHTVILLDWTFKR